MERRGYNFGFGRVWRGISHSDGMIKVDENPTIAFNAPWINENVSNTNVTVRDARQVVKTVVS